MLKKKKLNLNYSFIRAYTVTHGIHETIKTFNYELTIYHLKINYIDRFRENRGVTFIIH